MKLIFAILFLILNIPAYAGSIVVTVTQTGQADVSRIYAIPDADIPRIIASWQIEANAANNAPAGRLFVLRYWIMKQLIEPTIAKVQSFEKQLAIDAVATPSPINPQ